MEAKFKRLIDMNAGELVELFSAVIAKKIKNPSPERPTENDLLSIADAAKLLGVSVPTMYGYCHHRVLPYIKQGKFLKFSRRELLEWQQQGRRATRQEQEQKANEYLKR